MAGGMPPNEGLDGESSDVNLDDDSDGDGGGGGGGGGGGTFGSWGSGLCS